MVSKMDGMEPMEQVQKQGGKGDVLRFRPPLEFPLSTLHVLASTWPAEPRNE